MQPFGLFRFFSPTSPQSGAPPAHTPTREETTTLDYPPTTQVQTDDSDDHVNAFLAFASNHETRAKRIKKR